VSVVEILAVGAHPDDVELGCGGLLLAMQARGYRFAILDVTAGEAGSRGSREVRAREAKAAADILGASARECLDLPDGRVRPTEGALRLAVGAIRKWRPKLIVSMDSGDKHPDHAATATLMERAAFLAALSRFEADGEPHRARRVIRYSRHPWFRPSFVVDISDFVERKLEAIRCYESQFTRQEQGARTPISAPGFEDDLKALWRVHGMGIGALYAEPFAMDETPAIPDPVAALCEERRDIE
jgi:bacillithiol biosynthesis deacetylase BshB1